MNEPRRKASQPPGGDAGPAEPRQGSDDAERSLGRAVAAGLPVATVLGAIAAGVIASLGSAVIVLACGALLGAIALLWTSVRTLSGDAPLPADMEALVGAPAGASELSEKKGRVLRALKDLESEHAIGKIDDVDYQAIAARYREDAKAVMREMDRELDPTRAEAERIAAEYLARRGLAERPKEAAREGVARPEEADGRRACPACSASNEPDAAFCKACGGPMRGATERRREHASG
jgi:hypothetical protein